MAPKLNLFYTLKLGPPSKKSDNFSQHWLGIDGTMIVALYLKSVDWRNDRAAVVEVLMKEEAKLIARCSVLYYMHARVPHYRERLLQERDSRRGNHFSQ